MTDAYSVQQLLGNRIAQTPPFGDYSQRVATTAFAARYWIDVRDFGAIGDGLTDDTKAIQNAINAAPTGGANIVFQGLQYRITSSLVVGNGSTSGQSTVSGVNLVGSGNIQAGGTTLVWQGASTSASMLVFLGPMKGWGITNIVFNGNNLAGGAFKLVAASYGQAQNFAILNCGGPGAQNIVMVSLTASPTGNPNCQFNTFNNYQIFLANTANTMAILFDGNGTNSATNTSLNTFNNGQIVFPTASTAMFGYYFRDTDSNVFINPNFIGGGSGTAAITFDYTGSGGGTWPSNNTFIALDPDGLTASAVKYLNSGSPGSAARPHRFYNILDGNTATYPKIANTTYDAEFVNPSIDLTGQTASIGSTNINPITLYVTGMYRISYYLEITATGNAVNISVSFGWMDDSGVAKTFTSALIAANAANYTEGDVLVMGVGGVTNITYSTSVSNPIGTGQYALHIRLEKMD